MVSVFAIFGLTVAFPKKLSKLSFFLQLLTDFLGFEENQQKLSPADDCGHVVLRENSSSGFIETSHYFIREGEDRLKCKWDIKTNCHGGLFKWRFDQFDTKGQAKKYSTL